MCSYGYVHCHCWYAVIYLDDLMILACTTHTPFVHITWWQHTGDLARDKGFGEEPGFIY